MRDTRKPLVHLTDASRAAYEAITDLLGRWPVRVEQERILLDVAVEAVGRNDRHRSTCAAALAESGRRELDGLEEPPWQLHLPHICPTRRSGQSRKCTKSLVGSGWFDGPR